MKSRTSFFDKSVLRKDLTRFSPLWALYLIAGLLIMHTVSGFYGSYFDAVDGFFTSVSPQLARDLNYYIGPMAVFSGIYGFLCAQLLFGDLHSPRLCNGLHAFPLRREGWYLTHVTSGLLMGLVPPLVIALTLMPYLGQFWFTALLCWGGMALHYVLFFGLAVFCMMCTGNRFAASAVYGLVNFLSLIVHWFAKTIYLPLLPGVRANAASFNLFCPLVELAGRDEFFFVEHLDICPCYDINRLASSYFYEYAGPHTYAFQGLGSGWGYLLILAVAGITLLGLALALYRRRNLERAGDFMAFKPMKPIFLWVYTLSVGALLFLLGESMGDDLTGYVFFAIGLAIGYFTGRMLLERTLRVFKGKSWTGLGILYAAVVLSLLLTWIDPIGISRRIPDSERVEKVYLYDGHLSDRRLNTDQLSGRNDVIVVTDPEDIARICEIHGTMLEEHKNLESDSSRPFTIQYRLKNGATISRTYRIHTYGKAWNGLKEFMTKAEYLFGATRLEQLQEKVTYLHFSELGEIPESLWNSLLQALWADAQEGKVSLSTEFLSYKEFMYVEFQTRAGGYRALYFGYEAKHLNAWLSQYKTSPPLLLQHTTLEELVDGTISIYAHQYDLPVKRTLHKEFLSLLWQDCQNGLVENNSKWNEGVYVELETDMGWLSLALDPNSLSAQWLAEEFASE